MEGGFGACRGTEKFFDTKCCEAGLWPDAAGCSLPPCPQDARRGRTRRHPTLNQLNESIAAGDENIWNGNWKYRAEDGMICSINDLWR